MCGRRYRDHGRCAAAGALRRRGSRSSDGDRARSHRKRLNRRCGCRRDAGLRHDVGSRGRHRGYYCQALSHHGARRRRRGWSGSLLQRKRRQGERISSFLRHASRGCGRRHRAGHLIAFARSRCPRCYLLWHLRAWNCQSVTRACPNQGGLRHWRWLQRRPRNGRSGLGRRCGADPDKFGPSNCCIVDQFGRCWYCRSSKPFASGRGVRNRQAGGTWLSIGRAWMIARNRRAARASLVSRADGNSPHLCLRGDRIAARLRHAPEELRENPARRRLQLRWGNFGHGW